MKKLLLSMGLILVLVGSIYAFDRADLRSEVRRLTKDNPVDTSLYRWTDPVLNDRIEFSHMDLVAKTGCLQGTTYYTTHFSTDTYALPSDYIKSVRVAYKISGSTTAWKTMERGTFAYLDQWNPNWENMSEGLPQRYYIWGSSIGIVPAAGTGYTGTNYLRMDYIKKPTALSSDASIPFDEMSYLYPYHELIVWDVVARCKFDEDDVPGYQAAMERYFSLIKLMDEETKNKADYNPPLILRGPQ